MKKSEKFEQIEYVLEQYAEQGVILKKDAFKVGGSNIIFEMAWKIINAIDEGDRQADEDEASAGHNDPPAVPEENGQTESQAYRDAH